MAEPAGSAESPGGRAVERRGLSRRWGLAAACIVFIAILLWGFGLATPGAAASISGENGAAFLISWSIDTTIDLAVLAAWLAAAAGFGRMIGPSGCHGLVLQAVSSSVPLKTRPGVPDRATPSGLDDAARGDSDALLGFVTRIAVGIGVIGFLTLGLGIVGGLNRLTAALILVAGLALLPWKQANAIGPWLKENSPSSAVAWVLAMPLGVMSVAASIPPGILWKPLDPHPYDVVSYHLQIPREWFELGRIMPLPHNSFSYFPAGQEVHDLLMMHLLGGPWAGMFAAQFVSVAMTMLTALAVVGAVRSLRVGEGLRDGRSGLAWLAGLLAACVPWSLMLGSVAYVESGVMLYGTLAVVWAMRGIEKTAGRSMLIAGVCAGLAGGIKYTALAMTAVPVFVLWPIFAWPALGRRVLRSWLVGGVACAVVMSPWLVRNVAWSGNPVFPLATSMFGRGHFTAEQVQRYETAHAPPMAERSLAARLSAGWHRVVVDPQSGYAIVPFAIFAIIVLSRSPAGRFGGAVLIATSGVWLLATHDMPRFLAPAIPLAAVLIALAAAQWRAGEWIGGVTMIAVAGFGLTWTLSTFGPTLDTGRRAALFRRDLTALESSDVEAVRKAGGRLALVGDAQAFFYTFPAGQLRYRGVFDVVVPPGVSLADGWLGEPVDQLRAEGWWVLVAPSELVRLSGSYANLPKPTPPFDDPAGMPVMLPPTGAGK